MKEEKDGMELRHMGRENSCCSIESVMGDIYCETRETCMEAAKAGGWGWGVGVQSQAWLFPFGLLGFS